MCRLSLSSSISKCDFLFKKNNYGKVIIKVHLKKYKKANNIKIILKPRKKVLKFEKF